VLHLIQAACGNPGRITRARAGRSPHRGVWHGRPRAAATGSRPHLRPSASGDSDDRRDILAGAVPPTAPLPARIPARPPGVSGPRRRRARSPPAGQRPAHSRGSRDPGGGSRRAAITTGDREIDGGLRKARELLAFLAVHPGGSAEAISERCGPTRPPATGPPAQPRAAQAPRPAPPATCLPGSMLVVLAANATVLTRPHRHHVATSGA